MMLNKLIIYQISCLGSKDYEEMKGFVECPMTVHYLLHITTNPCYSFVGDITSPFFQDLSFVYLVIYTV